MANMDEIRKRLIFHLRDISNRNTEVEEISLQVLNDIAMDTGLFKKIIGFTIHADKTIYDFRDLTRINEQVETEVSAITIQDIPNSDIIKFILNPVEFPTPEVTKTEYQESEVQSMFVDLLDIFNDEGQSIIDKFDFHGTALYYANDQEWLDENDLKQYAFVASVIPHIDELLEEDLEYIMPTLIEGVKYYFNDTLQSTTDVQVANLYYQRYWQKRQALINKFPTKIFSITNKSKASRWL